VGEAAGLGVPRQQTRGEKGREKVSGTCEEMRFEKRGVEMVVR
jgi:hypothetical protein